MKLRSAGQHRKVRGTKTAVAALPEVVRAEGKVRIVFTDSLLQGHKFVVGATGSIGFFHQWTHHQNGKQLDKIGTHPSLTPEISREIIMKRNVLIAQGLDPRVPHAGIPKLSEFIEDEIIAFFRKKYKKLATVESQIRCWIKKYFKGDRDKPLNQYKRKDIVKFVEWVAAQRSAETANRCKSTLATIMHRAMDLEFIERNPCHGIKRLSEADSRDRIFSDSEFKRYCKVLMRHIGHLHAKILYVLVLIPLRFGEASTMAWRHLDFETSTYTIPNPKNGRRRVIAMNAPVLELLRQMNAERDPKNPWIFPAKSESGHVVNIRKKHKEILKEAQIDGFRTHDIRRSGASALLNDFDANPLKIRDILGHSDLRSTLVYARLSAKSMTETSDLLARKFNAAVTA
jgi:integrase